MSLYIVIDRAEYGLAVFIHHFDSYAIAEAQERCCRVPLVNGLVHPFFNDARKSARAVVIGDCSRSDDGAGAEIARSRRVADQNAEIEAHIRARVGRTKELAIKIRR